MLAYLWLVIIDETQMRQWSNTSKTVHTNDVQTVLALLMYIKVMEKLDKGTGILQTVSVAEYNEPAWDTWLLIWNWKKKSS